MGWDAIDVYELPGEGPGGTVRKARRAVGARAFGFNHFTFPPDHTGHEHDHAADGEEEVYVVTKGTGVLRVDGQDLALRPGVIVRVDPASTRVPISGAEGLEFLTIGAPLEGTYEPPSWG